LEAIQEKEEKASRVLEEFANVRTILPNFSSFLRLRIHSILEGEQENKLFAW
jgi:predicted DNA-binding ribbon-helix-helix protein